MNDLIKTNAELLKEISVLKQKIKDVEQAESERRQAEDDLRRSEEKYRNIFNNTQDIYYEGAIDGTILEVSPSVEKILKYTREELLGSSVNALYFSWEERALFIREIRTTGKAADYEITLKGKDGR
ncbi:MAG: PAS domain S-box protein, partial [Syntrophales bacterium]|nr:PAS domain S-box protein [Syntrophales bacterium]